MPRLSREHEMKLHNFDIDFFNTELKYYYADFTLCILAKPHCLDIENVFKIGSSTESEANYNIAGICEFALINLEKYYNTKDEKYLNLFLSNIKWLESNAVINSETAYWYYTYEMGEYSGNKWASSISQGMAASVMTRAYVLLKEEKYLDLAIKAVNTILTPVHQGGFKYSYDTFKCFYEESGTNSHILNGHIYAMLGIYDVYRLTKNDKYLKAFEDAASDIKNNIRFFDLGFASTYDTRERIIANNSYHIVNTNLIYILAKITKDVFFEDLYKRWNKIFASKKIKLYACFHTVLYVIRAKIEDKHLKNY